MPEYRKLIGFGKSSLVVSLPKDWVQKNKLKKGDTISMNVLEDQLNLSAQDKPIEAPLKTATIRTENKSKEKIRGEIVAAYLMGNNVIEVRGDNLKDHAQFVKSVLQNFAGLELMEQDAKKIVAKDLIDLSELSVNTILRRVDIILRSMFQDAISEEDTVDNLFARDKDVNRLVYLVRRVIRLALEDHRVAKRLKVTNLELLKEHEMMRWMELSGDQIKRVNKLMNELPKNYKSKSELFDMLKKMEVMYLEVMKAFHTNNVEKAYEINISHDSLLVELDQLSKQHNTYPSVRIVQILINLSHNIKNLSRTVIL